MRITELVFELFTEFFLVFARKSSRQVYKPQMKKKKKKKKDLLNWDLFVNS